MTALGRNLANLVVLVRTLLAIGAIALLSGETAATRFAGLAVLVLSMALDGLDGYLARRLSITSRLGSALDTLGDRVTENVFFVFLAYHRLVPLAVPLLFVTRSFLADFLRSLHAENGVRGTFAMNTSRFGATLVASPASRTTYLLLKFAVFVAGGWSLASGAATPAGAALREYVYWGSVAAAAFNVLRFAALVHDSRGMLRKEFGA
jgi:phosphatidylglycerophosphate synthase